MIEWNKPEMSVNAREGPQTSPTNRPLEKCWFNAMHKVKRLDASMSCEGVHCFLGKSTLGSAKSYVEKKGHVFKEVNMHTLLLLPTCWCLRAIHRQDTDKNTSHGFRFCCKHANTLQDHSVLKQKRSKKQEFGPQKNSSIWDFQPTFERILPNLPSQHSSSTMILGK